MEKMFDKNHKRTILIALILGIMIFGIIGRIILAGIALASGKSLNLSVNGFIQTLIISGFIGLFGGIVRQILFFIPGISSFLRGVLVGLILFTISIMFLIIKNGFAVFDESAIFFTLFGVGIFYILFGLLLEKFLDKYKYANL